MFKKFNNDNKVDNNLKMMSISAIVLVVLFAYVSIKSDNAMQGGSYYIGVIFLFILMGLAFALQKYKNKIRPLVSTDDNQQQLSFQEELESTKTPTSSEIKAVTSNISFKDVAGIDDIKVELEEIVDFLNNPKKYQKYNVSLPKGVLLIGPPGVGKTLIARAIAGEAQVPFFYQSGASFVHIYVGMGAKRVKELFNEAKTQAPSIIFIDEIDAVGKSRGLGANDEREATLNELLTQMDGFDGHSGVIVIAATNKLEVLDEALLRAGRFDRRIFLSNPTKKDRLKILELYLKHKKYSFDIEKLASDTSGFSSSALATLINESMLNMIKRDGTTIVDEDIEISKQKIQYGKKQIVLLDEEQKDILATYQAGKALITKEKVCLLDCGINKKDILYPSKTQLINEIKKYLAGSIALEVLKNESYVVFEDEIKEAYKLAIKMVEDYKMESSHTLLIQKIEDELKTKFLQNLTQLKELKEVMIQEEVIVF